MRNLLCIVGKHKYKFVRTIPGVKVVEQCQRCPHERVKYVGPGIEFARKSW